MVPSPNAAFVLLFCGGRVHPAKIDNHRFASLAQAN
jgi:hypothetical protein